jgi:hypothetical protein
MNDIDKKAIIEAPVNNILKTRFEDLDQVTMAAWVNVIFCNSFACAPLVVVINKKRYPSHTSGVTIPTAITMGESGNISGKELIASLVADEGMVARLQSSETRRGSGHDPWSSGHRRPNTGPELCADEKYPGHCC